MFSPVIIDDQAKPYLVLSVEKLLSTVTLDAWTINVSAELGTLELLDSINTGKYEINGNRNLVYYCFLCLMNITSLIFMVLLNMFSETPLLAL